MGKAHIAFPKRLDISPSGIAMRKLSPIATINIYHFGLKVQSIILIIIVISIRQAISKNREGNNHWKSLLA